MRPHLILYIVALYSLWTISCQMNNTIDNDDITVIDEGSMLETNEIELVSHTISELLSTDLSPPPPPIRRLEESKKEYNERIIKENQEYQMWRDKTHFSFYLSDTLIVPSQDYFSASKDTVYSGLAESLFSDTLTTRRIDLKKINNIKGCKLLTNKPYKKWSEWSSNIIGVAQYSRIIYNEEYSKAFFYFDFFCGVQCASGYLILAEKKKDRWIIIRKDLIWVA